MHAFGAQIGGFGVCADVQKWCEGVQPPEHLRNTMIHHCAAHAQITLSLMLDTGLVQPLWLHWCSEVARVGRARVCESGARVCACVRAHRNTTDTPRSPRFSTVQHRPLYRGSNACLQACTRPVQPLCMQLVLRHARARCRHVDARVVRAHQHRDVTSQNGGPEVHQFWHCWNPPKHRS